MGELHFLHIKSHLEEGIRVSLLAALHFHEFWVLGKWKFTLTIELQKCEYFLHAGSSIHNGTSLSGTNCSFTDVNLGLWKPLLWLMLIPAALTTIDRNPGGYFWTMCFTSFHLFSVVSSSPDSQLKMTFFSSSRITTWHLNTLGSPFLSAYQIENIMGGLQFRNLLENVWRPTYCCTLPQCQEVAIRSLSTATGQGEQSDAGHSRNTPSPPPRWKTEPPSVAQ